MIEEEVDETLSKISKVMKSGVKLQKKGGLVRISSIKSEKINWLWSPYIPLGRVSMLGGDPGAGKSFITTAIATALSNGTALPGEKEGIRGPVVTLLLSVEDDPADTIKPRLEALGANLDCIYISLEDIQLDQRGLDKVKELAIQSGAKLVIIDPIVAFMAQDKDMSRATDVRTIMKGLLFIARELNIAILVVRHNRKDPANATSKAIYAGMGSIDFTASVRSEMAVVEAKNGVKFFNHIKANSGRKGKSLTYSITSEGDEPPVFKWGEFANWPPLVGSKFSSKISKTVKGVDKARRWLFDLLKPHPNGLAANSVKELARLEGFSETKLNMAKKGFAKSVPQNGGWVWTLCPDSKVDISGEDEVE